MTCVQCSSPNTGVKASRGPSVAATHIPAQVREDIAENIGFVTNHWYARQRVCTACLHVWWTVECSVDSINALNLTEASHA
jgi:hypothetical protein